MAEITRRRTGELLRKLFEVLIPVPDGLAASAAIERLGRAVTLSEYERGSYESGGIRFDKIVRFATIGPVKAGWLQKDRGRWSITEAGRRAYEKFQEPEAFYREAGKLYEEWRSSQPDSVPDPSSDVEDPTSSKAASVTFEQAEEQAWASIEAYLHEMNPYDFQELVAGLLRAMGYHVSWVAPPGRDGGIDILASPDPLGTRPPRIKVQVKRQQRSVDAEGLRSFMALLGDDDVGLFVSTGGFTRDAQEEARTQERRRVTLLDLDRLFDLWVEHYARLEDSARRRLPLKPIHFLAPRD